MPRKGDSGGSSGCMASLTPASSATGTTFSRKYFRLSQSCSSVTTPASVSGAFFINSLSKPVTMAPPRPGAAIEVRVQLSTGIHSGHQTGMPTLPMLRISSQAYSISSSRSERPSLALLSGGRASMTSREKPPSLNAVFIRTRLVKLQGRCSGWMSAGSPCCGEAADHVVNAALLDHPPQRRGVIGQDFGNFDHVVPFLGEVKVGTSKREIFAVRRGGVNIVQRINGYTRPVSASAMRVRCESKVCAGRASAAK